MHDERRTSVLSLSYAAPPCDAKQLSLFGRVAEETVISNGSGETEPAHVFTRFLLHSIAPKRRSMRCASISRV
ncbi:hypothetical protein [Paraburkholderia haematera]|uniref:hypothetical protein n=1 Tax=Paraburkholderia haematera TaxID=2793077 RepID=UPI001B8B34EA|nr:hypothetical protein [Paraburkholderia haematera]